MSRSSASSTAAAKGVVPPFDTSVSESEQGMADPSVSEGRCGTGLKRGEGEQEEGKGCGRACEGGAMGCSAGGDRATPVRPESALT